MVTGDLKAVYHATTMQEHIVNDATEYVNRQSALITVNMDKFDGRAERINITLPSRLLHQIDE